MIPQVLPLGRDGIQQLSYLLPRRIHTARAYPLTAQDGSTIVVYGHEYGISAIWRGGSHSQERQEDTKPSYAPIIHTVDVSLGGAEALHIVFPQLPADMDHDTKSVPKLLSEQIVVAAACSDCAIRLITLPLTPPEGRDADEHILTLSGPPSHQSLPNCISITFTPRPSAEDGDIDMDDADETMKQITSRPASRSSRRSSTQVEVNWDLLVASHSPDLSGRLIIHRIPCNKTSLDSSAESSVPWSTHRLVSPAVSISFSSALYPSLHHSRLLVAEAKGIVRIMECTSKATNGPWLTSLYTDYEAQSETALSKRKSILDACWLLGGRAIIVLLSKGEWGVWDIENACPRPADVGLQTRTSMRTSPCFAIDGWVHTKVAKSTVSLENPKVTSSKLVPMTPSTRKVRQTALFAPQPQLQKGSSRGGIDIVHASNASNTRADDESVLLWHGTNIVTIPSFLTHWQNKIRSSGNLFGSGAKGEPQTIGNVQFNGEVCHEVSLNPASKQPEIVIAADRRLIIIGAPHAEKRQGSSATFVVEHLSSSTDDQLLAAGELDILGMDRVLDGMANGHDNDNDNEGLVMKHKFKMVKPS